MDMSWLQQMMGGQGMQGLGGAGPQMTPGAGMPPYKNAPMNMQRPQMAPPPQTPPAPPMGQVGQGMGPLNPAQMGMLSQMLAQRTPSPNGPPPTAGSAAGMPGAAAAQGQQIDPSTGLPAGIGMLAPFLNRSYGGPR